MSAAAAAGFNGVKLLLLVHCVFLYVCVFYLILVL